MSITFTAIDFETASASRASACSVGYTVVQDGQIVRTEHSLIFPPTGLEFTNSHIHGITEDHVLDAPEWVDVIEQVLSANPGAPLVAYSSFDKGVWGAAWKMQETAAPEAEFRDALALARHHLELEHYKLPHVVKHLGLPDFEHHHAGADALACARIVLHLHGRESVITLDELWPPAKPAGAGRPEWRTTQRPDANEDADPTHPLYGHVLCFTGNLTSMDRADAFAACAAVGAVIGAGVTLKTTLVIQGDYKVGILKEKLSSKTRKALDLMEKGKPIRVIGEEEFLALLR